MTLKTTGAGSAAHSIGRLWRLSPSAWLIAVAMAASVAFHLIPFYLPAADILAAKFIREKATADLLQSDPAAARLGPSELEAAVTRWTARHADTLMPLERQAEQEIRDGLTFEGEDGERHVYLGDEDGYYWLKLAKSLLAKGTVCDRIELGQCIDALASAPVGQPIEYTVSPHVYSIAALHRFVTWLRPGFPLSSTAMLVPLVLSTLVVIPAFLIAAGVSNPFGGLTAALLLSFNAVVFLRSSGGDDDIWVVALPVLSMGLITAAFGRRRWSARILLSGLGGVTLAVLAAAWKGWPLFALYTSAGLIAVAAWAALAALIARARGQPGTYALAGSAGLCMLATFTGFAAAGWLIGIQVDFGVITGGISNIVRHAASGPGPINTAPMPNVFHSVAELRAVDAASLQKSIGPIATGIGLLGFALALWPSRGRQALLVLALLVLIPMVAALLGRYGSTRAPVLAIPMLLGLATVIGSWRAGGPPTDRALATGILGLAWLGATLWMSFEGDRYILLAVAPLSVSAGVSLGRVASAIAALSLARAPLARAAGMIAGGGLAAAALGPVAITGLEQALPYRPHINSAWTNAFATIREQSSNDAIVDIWWDYGHWAKYYTERAVVIDGASLQNRAVHWIARALAAASDTETVGWLRLTNCGTVADPDGRSPARPYDMLMRWSADPGLAFRSMTELSRLPREEAAGFLRRAGLPDARAVALLKTAYCAPRESYLVLTTDLFYAQGWLAFGVWNPGLAHIVELARRYTVDEALPVIEQKYGLPEAAARTYYSAASRVQTERDEISFAASEAQFWSTDWHSCVPQGEALRCPLGVGDSATGPYLQDMLVDADNPGQTRIRILAGPGTDAIEATPALVEVARPDRLQDFPLSAATTGLAVLVDPDQKRVFVGTPGLVHSTLVRLALLDGRYSPGFQKIYDQLGVDARRVTVWRIGWGRP